MYCTNCGQEIDDQAVVCPHCGVQIRQLESKPAVKDSGSIWWAVLSFLIPLVGFILWLVWRDEKPKCAHKCAIGLWTRVALVVVLVVFAGLIVALDRCS